ncbi:MAG TPA: mismatch-specific DNA-glycosylase [Rhodanobacteraceae bacterium]
MLQPGLAVVFCGTAPSRRSAAEHAYYAHPGNFFWRALFEAGLTPRRLVPHEFTQLPSWGIGLTDLAKRHSGNDDELPKDAFDTAALTTKIHAFQPRLLAFTSKNAAQAMLGHAVGYGMQDTTIDRTRLFVLPSPSGQARRFWDIRPWRDLALRVSA